MEDLNQISPKAYGLAVAEEDDDDEHGRLETECGDCSQTGERPKHVSIIIINSIRKL